MRAHRFAFPAMLAGSCLLAFGPLLVRLADVGPVDSAFWRLALAVGPLWLIARMAGQAEWPARHTAWLAALAGALFAADLAAWHVGIGHTTLANATLLANSTAFLFAAWGYAASRRWPGVPQAAALALAAGGTALLLGQSAQLSPRNLGGDLLSLLAAVFYTGYLIVVGRMRAGLGAFGVLLLATIAGAAALLPLALLEPGPFWPRDWTPVVLLALGSQVIGQGLIVYAVVHLRPLAAGLALLVQPVIAAAIGWGLFGEALGAWEAAGAVLIVAALLLVRLPERLRGAAPRDTRPATPDLRRSPR